MSGYAGALGSSALKTGDVRSRCLHIDRSRLAGRRCMFLGGYAATHEMEAGITP